jgi:hypothetical protein
VPRSGGTSHTAPAPPMHTACSCESNIPHRSPSEMPTSTAFWPAFPASERAPSASWMNRRAGSKQHFPARSSSCAEALRKTQTNRLLTGITLHLVTFV